MTAPTAAVVVFCCTVVLVPGRDKTVARLRARAPGASSATRRGTPAKWVVAVGALAGFVLSLRGGSAGLALTAAVGAAALALTRRVLGLGRLRRLRRQRQREVIMLCDALSAELRGGLPALSAVERSCADRPELAPVVAAARLGGDIPSALQRCGGRPGSEGLRAVAAAWEVAGTSGAALAAVLERVATSLRGDADARAEVEAALGPPRATAKMLAILPLFGVGLGSSIGADPLHFLVVTPWGLGCLSAGVLLALAGVWWVERLASSAEA